MMTKLKHTAVLLAGALIILVIVVWGIKHNMKPAEVQPEKDAETEAVIEEPEMVTETPEDFDIASGLKLKEKEGMKILKTDHFTRIVPTLGEFVEERLPGGCRMTEVEF